MAACFISRAIILSLAICVGGGVASAQTAAPIVYKTAASGGLGAVKLENRVDSFALNVAPHAPIPTFGPAPLASATPEPLPLRTAGVASRPTVVEQAVIPHAGPAYQVDGRWYVPAHEPNYDEVGIASWYGPTFHGKASASGETFDENDFTAAHPTLPIPSLVRVTNLENGKTVVVRLNDRGPFVDDRIIDMSKAAAAALEMHAKGTAKVRVQYVGPAPASGGGAGSAAPAPQRLNVAALASAPVAQVQAVTVPSTGAFYVQAGSFSDLGNAHALRDRLEGHGRSSIEAVMVNGDEFYRVMVGPWADRGQADAVRVQLTGYGAKGMVVAR